jgi:hypothetical protein
MMLRTSKVQLAVLMGACLLGTVAQAVTSDDLPYTIGWYSEAVYQLPDDAVAFNGIMDGDPYGIDIIVSFGYYVEGPMTFWASKDGTNWTWLGASHWMLSAANPVCQLRLTGNSWDPDDWAKYIKVYNTTYRSDPYYGVIVLTGVEPLFPGRDPTLPSNQVPVAAPDAAQTEAGLSVTIDVLENDYDPDGDLLAVTSVGPAIGGTVAINTDGTVTYTPDAGFTGPDAFVYTISDGNGGTAEATVNVAVSPRNVLIDIKPGSYPNSINLGSNGVVPVAILSEPDFDATLVDPGTVSLAGAGVAVRGKGSRLLAHEEDVNDDGLLDLVLQVETENLKEEELQAGSGTIVGATYEGVPIIGSDTITIVPAS